ncbi:hypothetical protein [Alkalihalobacillus sp. AL-G]|uniref:hypothetical protein n=1 Tax=Alkalihalobacillus sp. AL-G TaxID=2926399 RepID=UPI00272C842C|nr:hypothetical protein [Alkalihalobacillus sp. AL-G]WLD92610.1 hypothetical protein MOJ78_16565 [Alkalihalobacillus sp. AL-G]
MIYDKCHVWGSAIIRKIAHKFLSEGYKIGQPELTLVDLMHTIASIFGLTKLVIGPSYTSLE